MSHLPLSALAVRLGMPEYKVRAAVRDGLIPVEAAGRVRFVREADVDAIRQRLAAAGVLDESPAGPPAADR